MQTSLYPSLLVTRKAAQLKVLLLGILCGSLILLLSACEAEAGKITHVRFEQKNLYPEGIAYDSEKDQVLVSSMKFGMVGTVNVKNLTYTPFIEDETLISTSGLTVDAKRRRLYVANVDVGAGVRTAAATQTKLAGVAVYDLDTKKRLAYFELHKLYKKGTAKYFANEIELDNEGNAYVTDSFSPVIYRIRKDLSGAELWFENPAFTGEGFNLNGLTFLDQNTLLVAKYNSGELYLIDIPSKKSSQVTIPAGLNLTGADGVHALPDEETNAQNSHRNGYRKVVVVANKSGEDKIVYLQLDQQNKAIKEYLLVNELPANRNMELNFPTTLDQYKDGIVVLNGALGDLFQGKERNQFEIITIQGKPGNFK